MTTSNAIADTVSLEFTGGNSWGSTPYSASQAFAYVDHVSGANLCLDLSSQFSKHNSYEYISIHGWLLQ